MRWITKLLVLAGMLLVLGVVARPALADDDVNDVALPSDEAAIELGKQRYGKCSGFCHGAAGKGGRAPCLVCGRFKRGGKNSQIIHNIAEGVPGTAMGAFKEQLSRDEILAVVAYLRVEQKKKEAEGQ